MSPGGTQRAVRRQRRKLGGKAAQNASVAADRDPAIYAERLKGKSEPEIAREFGIAQQTVSDAIDRQLALRNETVGRLRGLQADRVQRIHKALQPRVDEGDTDAARTILLAEKRLADLLGLDAAKKHEVTGAGGAPLLTLEAARALIAAAKQAELES